MQLTKCKILKPYNTNNNYDIHTGIDIECTTVLNYISGVVLYTGTDGYTKSVIVQYDHHYCFKYDNLVEIYVNAGDIVSTGVELGKAKGFLHFECITSDNIIDKFPVRVGCRTYYKIDPTPFIVDNKILADPNNLYEVN